MVGRSRDLSQPRLLSTGIFSLLLRKRVCSTWYRPYSLRVALNSQALGMQTTVSAIIPTHNRSGSIIRALKSVYAQQTALDEIIVVDDGSTDDTAELIKCEFPEALLISQERHGVSHARNRGVDAAQGEWLAFLDSDDEWLPNKIQAQLEMVSGNSGSLIVHSDEIWIRNGKRVNPMKKHKKHGGWIFEHCLERCVISPSSVLLHCSLFHEFGNFDETLPVCEDYDLWLRLTATLPVLHIPRPLVRKYGGHSDQLSRSEWGIDRYRIRSLEKLLSSKKLKTEQIGYALAELIRKIEIYLTGAYRRQRYAEIQCYEEKKAFYENMQSSPLLTASSKSRYNA